MLVFFFANYESNLFLTLVGNCCSNFKYFCNVSDIRTYTMTIFRHDSEFLIRRISSSFSSTTYLLVLIQNTNYDFTFSVSILILSAKLADGRVVFAIFKSYYDVS